MTSADRGLDPVSRTARPGAPSGTDGSPSGGSRGTGPHGESGPGGCWDTRSTCRARIDTGTVTAEYAIATLAACGFAGLLVALMRSDLVRGLLAGVIQRALGGI